MSTALVLSQSGANLARGEKALTVTSRFITVRNAPQRVTGGPHSHKATTRPSDVLCFWVIHLWVSPDSGVS